MSRVICITGASAGIGQTAAKHFVANGWRVVGVARRLNRLEALRKELGDAFYPFACDVSNRASVMAAFAALPAEFADIDVLVNSAGLGKGLDLAQDAKLDDWDVMIQTNINGLLYCTRAVLPGMVARNSGFIVNLGSIAGEYNYQTGNVYGASKAFVKHFTQNLKADLLGTMVRVCCIEPGLTRTEFQHVRFDGDEAKSDAPYQGITPLTAEDISEAIWWVVNQPEHVTVTSVEIWPTHQANGPFSFDRQTTD
ncbi:MAG: SDR family NAD(P)-dependent oxidoreductase [Desulfobulbaceae bacterium]|nr:MAG: SDR family NAD(P)-dependent oxidoreductase [Desulfobulbaceae bacterium]